MTRLLCWFGWHRFSNWKGIVWIEDFALGDWRECNHCGRVDWFWICRYEKV